MNILVIAEPTTTHNQKKINYLAQQGHTCYVMQICLEEKKKIIEWEEIFPKHDNVHILKPIFPFSSRKIFTTIKEIFYLYYIVKKYKIDALLVLFVEPGALWGIFLKLFKKKVVLFTYGSDVLITIPNFFKRNDFSAKITQKLYLKAFCDADYVLSTSYTQAESIEKFIFPKKTKKPIQVVRTGVDIDKIKKKINIKTPDFAKNKKVIFFPRDMKPLYNHEFCLEAIAKLPQNIRDEYSFVFVDKDNPNKVYVNKIKELMKNINAEFIFLPLLSQNELFGILQFCEMVIMTPVSDGSPVSAMEALYFERPLILGSINYDKDIFSEPVLQLSKWDSDELVEFILYIINNKRLIKSKMSLSKKRIEQYCDMNKELKRLNSIMEE